ncbi:hypothetical protein VPH35_010604 [Triticum aestivum]
MDVARVAPRRRRKKTRAAAPAATTLPEDVVIEILVRVADAAALFRCAPSLIGFFAQQWHHASRIVPTDPLAGPRSPAFVPAPRLPLGPNCRSLDSFVSGAPAVGTGQTLVHLAVCDLLAGTCDALPPLECTASSSINNCVLVIVFDPDTSYYYLCPFSSARSTWSDPTPCFSKTALRITDGSAAVGRGVAHWFACDSWETCRTLGVSTGTGRPSSTEVYIPQGRYDFGLYVTPWLGVAMDGALSLFHLHGGCRSLHVWTRHGRHNVNCLRPPEQKAICEDVQCLCADQGSSMLLVMDRLKRVYIVEVDEVTEQFQRLKLQTVVPFEMDYYICPCVATMLIQRRKLEEKLKEKRRRACTLQS